MTLKRTFITITHRGGVRMNKQDPKYENIELCKKCGGYCCKKSGCDYFVSDFENMKLEYLQ